MLSTKPRLSGHWIRLRNLFLSPRERKENSLHIWECYLSLLWPLPFIILEILKQVLFLSLCTLYGNWIGWGRKISLTFFNSKVKIQKGEHVSRLPWSEHCIFWFIPDLYYSNFHCSKHLACKKSRGGYSQKIVKISYFDLMHTDKLQEAPLNNWSKQHLQLLWQSLPFSFLCFLPVLLGNQHKKINKKYSTPERILSV